MRINKAGNSPAPVSSGKSNRADAQGVNVSEAGNTAPASIALSHSYMTALLCAYRGQRLLIHGDTEPDSPDALMGIILHFLAAKYGFWLHKHDRVSDESYYRGLTENQIIEHKLPEYMAEQIRKVGGNFLDSFKLTPGAKERHFERRFAVAWPSLQVIEPGDTTHPRRIEGTPDLVEIFEYHAVIRDYKMGFRLLEYDEAANLDIYNDARQLALYCWLVAQHYPQVESFEIELFAPMWGGKNRSLHHWELELLNGPVTARIEASWAKLEKWQKIGGVWKAQPKQLACRFCMLTCPLATQSAKTIINGEVQVYDYNRSTKKYDKPLIIRPGQIEVIDDSPVHCAA